MPCNLQCEAIAKFLIPNRPQEDNYLDPNEFKEKEKEWMEQWDQVLACCTAWGEKEQLVENRHVQEAAHVAVGKKRLWHEEAEGKLKVGARKKVGGVWGVSFSRKVGWVRGSMK